MKNFVSQSEVILETQDELHTLATKLTTKLRLSYVQVTTMLKISRTPQTRKIVLETIGYKNHSDNYLKFMVPLLNESLITFTLPDTPKSPNQKYLITEKGEDLLKTIIAINP